ncbi:unnamed protein product, partial [Ascophyllum nodosum]
GYRVSAAACSSLHLSAPTTVSDTAGALLLAEAVNCSGGSFAVEWVGSVRVTKPITVSDDTVLEVSGATGGSSVMNGGGQNSLFDVSYGGHLKISELTLVNGTGDLGGALSVVYAVLQVNQCSFIGNAADAGGAIFVHHSRVHLTNNVSDVSFVDNVALQFGGGIFGFECSFVVMGNAEWKTNEARYGGGVYLFRSNLFSATGKVVFANNVAEDGGGLILTKYSTMTTPPLTPYASWTGEANCGFWGNRATVSFGGAVIVHDGSDLHVRGNVEFTNNSAFDGGGAIFASNKSLINVAGTATYDSNYARFGGGAYITFDSDLSASGDITFINNVANETGGGMYLSDGSKMLSIIVAGNAEWLQNQADIGGGIFVGGDSLLSLSGLVKFLNNSATGGGALALSLAASASFTNIKFLGNTAGLGGGAVVFISSGTRDSVTYVSSSSFDQNRADEDGGAILVVGGIVIVNASYFTENIAGSSGGAVRSLGITVIDDSSFIGNRGAIGAALSSLMAIVISRLIFDDNALLCDDRYYLDWANASAYSTACEFCPDECPTCTVLNEGDKVQVCQPVFAHTTSASADGTLESLEVEPSYWRMSNTSKAVRECFRKDACVGGTESYCAPGYTGPFCAVCIAGYARDLGYICTKCTRARRVAVITVGVATAIVLIAIVVIGIRFLHTTEDPEARLRPRNQAVARIHAQLKRATACQAVKIVVVSWQIVSQASTVASVAFPRVYEAFIKFFDIVNLNVGWILSAGCLLDTSFYVNLLMSTIGPLALVSLVKIRHRVTTTTLRHSNRDGEIFARMNNKYGSTIFLLSFFFYATASSTVFQAFACVDVDSNTSYLKADLRLQCYTTQHKAFMVYAGIMGLVYPIGVPLAYGLVLYRSRATLMMREGRDDVPHVAAFKELWRPYRPEVFYYEVVECLRRVTLSVVVVFVSPSTAGQIATTFLFALLFFAMMLILDPYVSQWDTWLARIGHTIVVMTMFVALLEKVEITRDDMASRHVFADVLVAANCLLILAVVAEAL